MKKTIQSLGWILFSIGLTACTAKSQTHCFINDSLYKPPHYDTFIPPSEPGSYYSDPVFGTSITRVTNCDRFGYGALGGYFANSEICNFNIDGSYFIAVETASINQNDTLVTYLYNGRTGDRLQMLGTRKIRPWWIRWALANKYTKNGEYVYFDPKYCFNKFDGNEIRLYDIRDMDNPIILHKFTEYSQIGSAGGEGDISDDGRYWCLDGDAEELFVYDLIDDIKHPVSTFPFDGIGVTTGDNSIDYAAVSPSGDYVVVAWSSTAAVDERYHGFEVFDKNWTFLRQIHPGRAHLELGVDAFGDEVVYTSATYGFNDYFLPKGVSPGDLVSIRLSDGTYRLLKEIPAWAHYVMSACNSVSNGDHLYVSYIARSEDPDTLWAPFWGEIIQVPTDGSGQVRRLVHHRSRPVDGQTTKYWQPDAVVNRQGDRILFRSTFNHDTADLYLFPIDSCSNNTQRMKLGLKVFLDGPFQHSTQMMTNSLKVQNLIPLTSPYSKDPRMMQSMPDSVTDWILVQLREAPNDPPIVSKSALLHQSGHIFLEDINEKTIEFVGISAGDYYIVIRHRNHLAIMSAGAVSLNEIDTARYDFSDDITKYYGTDGAKQLSSGVWGLWSGEITLDGQITPSDFAFWQHSAVSFQGLVYSESDFNADGFVNTTDYNLWYNNHRENASSAIP